MFQTLYPMLVLDTDTRNGKLLTPIPTIFVVKALGWVSCAMLNIVISHCFYHSGKTVHEFLNCIF